jgi:HD-like signal output (HDOD) protein
MRILLVDDEPMLLTAFRRTLHQERPAWTVATAGTREEALAILTREAFDVVVTEILAGGAGFLEEIHRASPSMIRVVLSGQPRLDLMEAQEGHFHRFLSKPVDPDILVDILEELALREGDVLGENARKFVAGIKGIPSLPTIYVQIRTLLSAEDVAMGTLVSLVQTDLGIASKLLKLVNSAYFSLERKVTDLRQAINMLGLETVRTVVLVRGAMEALQALAPGGLDLDLLWRHSRGVANGARSIASGEGQPPGIMEDAYSLGLLHDIGRVILAMEPSVDYRQVEEDRVRNRRTLVGAERALFGTDHPSVGAQVLSLWGLPPEFCRRIREHHAPSLPREGFPAGLALYAADGYGAGPGDPFRDGQTDERILATDDPGRPARWATLLSQDAPGAPSHVND